METLSATKLDELQQDWSASLNPAGDNEREDKTFRELEAIREDILNL